MRDLARLLVFLLVSFFNSFALAEKIPYWVVGSFANASNAAREAARVTSLTGTEAQVQFHKAGNVFRVVLPASAIGEEQLAAYTLKGWMLTLSASPVISEEPESEVREVVLQAPPTADLPATVTNDWSPLYPALQKGESLPDYCQRVPDSSLCTDPRSEELLERARKLDALNEDLHNACQRISNPEYRETCMKLEN